MAIFISRKRLAKIFKPGLYYPRAWLHRGRHRFLFAYNWDDLPKFVKLGLTELLLIATTVIALMPKFPH